MADIITEVSQIGMPFNNEAEQSVLGGLILHPDSFSDVLSYISSPDSFYLPVHKGLFSCLIAMYNVAQPIDNVTVAEEAVKNNVFDSLEKANEYITFIMAMIPSLANIEGYCKIVQDKFYSRKLIEFAQKLIDTTVSGENNASDILESAEQQLYDIRQGKDVSNLTPISDAVIQYYDKLAQLTSTDKDDYAAVSTGFKSLDAIIHGLNRSDLLLVAGRPGMGKSSFAVNVAVNVAKNTQKNVAIFNLEMSNEQITARILSSLSGITSEKFRTGNLDDNEWPVLSAAADNLSRQTIYLDDTADITVGQMKAKLRRVKNLGLVVIDYLQLMSSGKRSENRVQEVSQITRALKIMAKELDVPVILCSQLSRATEQRQGHKPMLSDLRESGSIEQDADIVMFLYREGYYNKECEYPNLAQCIVAKNRHGATAEADLMWCGERTSFFDSELIRDEDDYAGY